MRNRIIRLVNYPRRTPEEIGAKNMIVVSKDGHEIWSQYYDSKGSYDAYAVRRARELLQKAVG